jgi:phage gpG-like protein
MAQNPARMILNRLPKMRVAFAALTRNDVLVGVPNETADRKTDATDKEPMNNATLAYIHDNGSPAANIPARPFMRPGVEAVKARIITIFKGAALAAPRGAGAEEADKALHKAGLVTQASIRNTINEGIAPTLAPNTLSARRARGRTGDKPLIDTGQLRNSINYVIRLKK